MNDYLTFFYVKHFELPMCMKCAIQINLPCLALPILTSIKRMASVYFSLSEKETRVFFTFFLYFKIVMWVNMFAIKHFGVIYFQFKLKKIKKSHWQFCDRYSLKNKAASKRCHRRAIFGSTKNSSVKGSLNNHLFPTFLWSEEPSFTTNNLLWKWKVLQILKVLYGSHQ